MIPVVATALSVRRRCMSVSELLDTGRVYDWQHVELCSHGLLFA
jgi:hypothetical protein